MSTGTALEKFSRVTSVSNGELIVSAGKYSRAAIIAVFEMNGGVEAFAEWAELNKTEFYTKLFPKLIGRETEEKAPDNVEDLLLEIDDDVEDADVEYDDAPDTEDEHPQSPVKTAGMAERLAGACALYAEGEPAE
jgi:hypothetical protein